MRDEMIYKYPLEMCPVQTISAPISRVLTVQVQNGKPCLWAVVDKTQAEKPSEIYLCGTGTQDGYSFEDLTYIGTTQMYHFVFHWFYKEVRHEDKAD